jgi:hypothetical protein
MHRIIVSINNKKNTRFIMTLLQKFDFVKFEPDEIEKEIPFAKRKGNWSNIIGIWKDRDINIDSIREKAWPKRT